MSAKCPDAWQKRKCAVRCALIKARASGRTTGSATLMGQSRARVLFLINMRVPNDGDRVPQPLFRVSLDLLRRSGEFP